MYTNSNFGGGVGGGQYSVRDKFSYGLLWTRINLRLDIEIKILGIIYFTAHMVIFLLKVILLSFNNRCPT